MNTAKALLLGGVAVGAAVVASAAPATIAEEAPPIGIVDFYGLSRLSAGDLRPALTFREGDAVSLDARPAFLAESEQRLSRLPGVGGARIHLVCCEEGRVIAYVGIQEDGAPALRFRPAPAGTARLAADVVRAGAELDQALGAATQRGDAAEDHAQGHALAHDPAARAVQERFVLYARRDRSLLRKVLRESSDPSQRALAAYALGYVSDKPAVVGDLVRATTDPSEEVRNDAMRTLFVFMDQAPAAGRAAPRVPAEPFVALLRSPVWTDRNKASLALMALTKGRDAAVLARLRRDALEPLAEIARWKSPGHAWGAFLVLARLANLADEAAQAAWDRGERETVIAAALRRP